MAIKEKIKLEFPLNTGSSILYNRISTPGGLGEWFADNVRLENGLYIFSWNDEEQKAQLINRKKLKFVRFKWVDEEDNQSYFEFRISTDELTDDVALIVTDFVEPDEKDTVIELWETQIAELKSVIGA